MKKSIFFVSIFTIIFYSLIVLLIANTTVNYNQQLTFKKDNQTIILHGMTHTAPEDFYLKTIEEIQEYKNKNYIYGYELIKYENDIITPKTLIKTPQNKTEKIINFVNQDNYFELFDGINLDISQEHYENLIKSYGYKFTYSSTFEPEAALNKAFDEPENYNFIEKTYSLYNYKLSFLKVYLSDNFGEKTPDFRQNIILDYRNLHVIDSLNNKDNYFITYGNAHLDGMKDLLIKKGYVLINSKNLPVY